MSKQRPQTKSNSRVVPTSILKKNENHGRTHADNSNKRVRFQFAEDDERKGKPRLPSKSLKSTKIGVRGSRTNHGRMRLGRMNMNRSTQSTKRKLDTNVNSNTNNTNNTNIKHYQDSDECKRDYFKTQAPSSKRRKIVANGTRRNSSNGSGNSGSNSNSNSSNKRNGKYGDLTTPVKQTRSLSMVGEMNRMERLNRNNKGNARNRMSTQTKISRMNRNKMNKLKKINSNRASTGMRIDNRRKNDDDALDPDVENIFDDKNEQILGKLSGLMSRMTNLLNSDGSNVSNSNSNSNNNKNGNRKSKTSHSSNSNSSNNNNTHVSIDDLRIKRELRETLDNSLNGLDFGGGLNGTRISGSGSRRLKNIHGNGEEPILLNFEAMDNLNELNFDILGDDNEHGNENGNENEIDNQLIHENEKLRSRLTMCERENEQRRFELMNKNEQLKRLQKSEMNFEAKLKHKQNQIDKLEKRYKEKCLQLAQLTQWKQEQEAKNRAKEKEKKKEKDKQKEREKEKEKEKEKEQECEQNDDGCKKCKKLENELFEVISQLKNAQVEVNILKEQNNQLESNKGQQLLNTDLSQREKSETSTSTAIVIATGATNVTDITDLTDVRPDQSRESSNKSKGRMKVQSKTQMINDKNKKKKKKQKRVSVERDDISNVSLDNYPLNSPLDSQSQTFEIGESSKQQENHNKQDKNGKQKEDDDKNKNQNKNKEQEKKDKKAKGKKDKNSETWECDGCGFENQFDTWICFICSTKRSQSN